MATTSDLILERLTDWGVDLLPGTREPGRAGE